jgi:type VI secretion system secreted protein Hcp
MAIYMKYGDIKGDVTHDKHKGWLQIDSMQFGVDRAFKTGTGRTGNREASLASVSEVTISKTMDASGPRFFLEACIGWTARDVMLNFVRTGDPGETFLSLRLSDALVSSYSLSSSGERPAETICINFSKVEMKYTGTKADNSIAPSIAVSYDLTTARGS